MPPIFTIGWVCALPIELAAARVVMDERYEPLPSSPTDTNIYTFGRIGVHNVVAACLPAGQIGTNAAAVVASQMWNSFPSLRFGMLVGIGGGVPSDEHDIRLGDVVISQPAAQYGGVVQFDFGKTGPGGKITRTGILGAPPPILLSALANLHTNILLDELHIREHLSAFSERERFACPGSKKDVMYSASSKHVPGPTCASCRTEDIIVRQARATQDPVLFFGTIASGNQVMKDAPTRDRTSQELGGVLCFEMEAAGLMNNFGCLVVRGICDYADAHKNKQWQPYAAATAAVCAKELLLLVPQAVSATGNIQMAHPTLAVRSAVISLSNEDKDCLRSLAFPEQESRGQEIHFAQNTCQWLLMDNQYWEWTKKSRGLFWVKGSPGTGKSAVMKFAATTMRSNQPGDLVFSYFISGRGTDLQKSLLGVFRALLNTMLSSFPQYLSQLTKIFKDREERYGSYRENRWSWAVPELQDCMLKALSQGTKYRSVIIFIDALDECGEHDARALLNYFQGLTQQIEMERGKVKICFSSRHYPILGSDTIPTVFVENQNGGDIQLVVHKRLRQIAPGNRRQQIEAHILSKSQGGFQWAVLVTEKILDGDAMGTKEANLLKMLTSIPETLDGLYGDILKGSTGAKEKQMVKLFQWVLFARRPLSSQELREALATDKDADTATVDSLRQHDSWVENLSRFETHVKTLSRGLVEFQDRDIWEQHEPGGEPWNREAQFIHQSVADYLVETFLPHSAEDRNAAQSVVGVGHFEISRSCLRYITLSNVLDGACLPRGELSARFPLAPYAVQFLYHHIHRVELEGLPQLDLLSLVYQDRWPNSLQRISHLWNVLDPNHAHCSNGWPFVGAVPLHILIAFGSKSAIDAALREKSLDINARDSEGNTPLLFAIEKGQPEIALAILNPYVERRHGTNRVVQESTNQHQGMDRQRRYDVDVNATNDDGHTALDAAMNATTTARELIRWLVEAGAIAQSHSMKVELVVYATRTRDSSLFMHFIEKYGPLDGAVYFLLQELSKDGDFHILEEFVSKSLEAGARTSRSPAFDKFSDINDAGRYDNNEEAILLASRQGQTSIVDLLLSHNASPDCSNGNGRTPLMAVLVNAALVNGHLELLKLLVDRGARPDYTRDSGKIPLYTAVAEGKLEMVKLLLDKGASPDYIHDTGTTPLYTAVAKGELEMVKLLLDKGARPDCINESGKTPLCTAVAEGKLGTVKLLLDKGARPDCINESGKTPLCIAVAEEYLEMVILLLDRGASPDYMDNPGETPLYTAAAAGNSEIVRLLLEDGAIPDYENNSGETPFYIAAAGAHLEIMRLLSEYGAYPDYKNNSGEILLYTAAAKGYFETVRLLLEYGVSPDYKNNFGETPLYTAAAKGHFEIVRLLMEDGAIPDYENNFGETPLYIAAAKGHFEIVRLLIEDGAIPDYENNFGETPLYIAAAKGYFDIVKLLLEYGATSDYKNNSGETPLFIAAAKGHLEIVGLFQEYGAIPNYKNNFGGAPFLIAAANGRSDITKVLQEYRDIPGLRYRFGRTPLILCSICGDLRLVRLLLEEGASLNHKDYYGETPLYLAAAKGHFEIVRLLLERGANPNISNMYGTAPLNIASAGGYLEVVGLLLEKDACINAQDDDGRTPLCAASLGNHLDIARLLLENGADPNIGKSQQSTPLHIALERQYMEIADLLIEMGAKPLAIWI